MIARPALDDLIALALAAGREINAVREAGFEAQRKLDGSIVTIADQRAEAIIEAGLQELAPHIPMIGEEAVAEGRIPAFGDLFFCVDPLDGTKGFAAGGDQFTVNIGLVEHGLPIMGVVYAPASGELFAGEPGHARAARYNPQTGELLKSFAPIVANTSANSPWRIIASENSGRDSKTASFIAALAGEPAHASSSIKFCRIAEGAADIYPRFGDICEWDAAAAHAILTAAGGGMMRLDGSPMLYGDSAGGFLIHGFVAYANDAAKQAALRALT